MAGFMSGYEAQTYAALRIVTGFLFLWYGTSKLFDFPVPPPPEAPAFVIYVAGSIELVGGLLVAIGLKTRLAAFLCSGLMAAAYWMAHGTKALLPIQNQGDLAAIYRFVFLNISARGSGIWSAAFFVLEDAHDHTVHAGGVARTVVVDRLVAVLRVRGRRRLQAFVGVGYALSAA